MNIEDGGPAFPRPGCTKGAGFVGDTNTFYAPTEGMSLRDWFAGKALYGYLANPKFNEATHNQIADECYKSADAMLRRREKPEEKEG